MKNVDQNTHSTILPITKNKNYDKPNKKLEVSKSKAIKTGDLLFQN